jgi:hypothetical protein
MQAALMQPGWEGRRGNLLRIPTLTVGVDFRLGFWTRTGSLMHIQEARARGYSLLGLV